MNQPTKQTYQNDLIIQSVFYLPMMALYPIGFVEIEVFIIGALLQFFVGVTQVLSGAFHSIRYRDDTHKRYFLLAVGYLLFLFIGGTLLEYLDVYLGILDKVFIILFLFIIPVGIATWYYRLTWLAYKNADVFMDGSRQSGAFREDVLDDVML
ncbi:hypothetical protein [Aureispira sp. CCB-QB1]|uniref:hypothetical protein n=1 Tax=Aureispira sp. CCB-QB1 TaxID=1313421 RepID=UPI000695BE7B|nr:hypothetical protein [Aureispira sp. CCB-QB1]